MHAKLQLLIDHFEVREVIEAYVHACDRGDERAVAGVYHPDSWDDHGPMKMSGADFAKAVTDALLTHWSSASHLLGQSRIKVDGDEAGAETYFFASLTRDAGGVAMLDQMVGRYVDRLQRLDGEWRIKDRICICEWSSSGPMGEDFLQGHLFAGSSRSPDDPSFGVLRLDQGRARISR